MKRILLRSGKSPFHVLSPRASLEDYPSGVFAINSGNMVFSDAMHRILSTPGTDVIPNTYLGERLGVNQAYLDRVNSDFSHFVVPLANAFRPPFVRVLDRLTDTIEGLHIPVTVVGVGVEGGPNSLTRDPEEADEEVKRAARRFMNAVLDRSSRVGVRGEHTRRFLRGLGYGDNHVEVIGCPSLFRYGDELQIDKSPEPIGLNDPISINITPYVRPMGECALRHAARYPNMVYIPQDLATLRLLITHEEPATYDCDMPTHSGHPLYRDGRMLFFVDSASWIEFLKTVRFCFGTRIHGNIAALVAGTPAVVLVHDLRTQELVDYHQIPYRLADDAAGFDAADLYEEADFTNFNVGHAARFATFQNFLHENGIATVFDPGHANPGYDERLAALPLPGPVRPDFKQRRGRTIERLTRRWQRTIYRFAAPVPHAPSTLVETAEATIARMLGPVRSR